MKCKVLLSAMCTMITREADYSTQHQAKTFAGKLATGKILVYLDAHCECNDGWLEPLIYPIYLNRTACTTPNIDSICMFFFS